MFESTFVGLTTGKMVDTPDVYGLKGLSLSRIFSCTKTETKTKTICQTGKVYLGKLNETNNSY